VVLVGTWDPGHDHLFTGEEKRGAWGDLVDHFFSNGDYVLYSTRPGIRLFFLAYSHFGIRRVYGGDGIKSKYLKLTAVFFLISQGLFMGLTIYLFFIPGLFFATLFFSCGYFMFGIVIFQMLVEPVNEEILFTAYDYEVIKEEKG
jgi:hypothetical protein